jgi:hypothetical protein
VFTGSEIYRVVFDVADEPCGTSRHAAPAQIAALKTQPTTPESVRRDRVDAAART